MKQRSGPTSEELILAGAAVVTGIFAFIALIDPDREEQEVIDVSTKARGELPKNVIPIGIAYRGEALPDDAS